MKKSIFVLGVAAFAVAMVSCNKDEIKKIDNPTFEGDKAYVIVNINDVGGSSTRATDGGFQYGSETEYAVTQACFYFYGSDGDFVTEADVWDSGSAVEGGNVEFKGYTVVALSGLTTKEYPSWVVTVLNPGSDFKAPSTLAEFEGLLADPEGTGIMSSEHFTMATSSFVPGESQTTAGYSSTYYFATPVSASNFALESLSGSKEDGYTDANGDSVDPVVIYVERLAAKVTLAVGGSLTGTSVGGDTLYEITVEEEVDGVATETAVYVKINGWTLNGTAKYSNAVKTIDTSWTFTDWTWNDATNYRSYWGKSFNYGLGIGTGYPSSAGDSDDTTDGTSYSSYLDYVSYEDCTTQISSGNDSYYVYCAENTNTAGDPSDGVAVINDKTSTAITNLLISATVCDESGNPLDLVRCDGVLYTQEDFLAYAANHIHLYTYSNDSGNDVYTQIGPDYLTLVNRVDGLVDVVLNETALGETQLYDSTPEEITVENANSYIDTAFNKIYGLDANGYTGGAMYYSIPIEHLNNATVTGDDDKTYPAEGNYGIVRNHIYVLTITDIENIGYGVFDPEEIIIPQPEPETYAITAQINILSWKLVEQSVTL